MARAKCVQNFGREELVGSDQLGHFHVEERITLNMSQKNGNTINRVIFCHTGDSFGPIFMPHKNKESFLFTKMIVTFLALP